MSSKLSAPKLRKTLKQLRVDNIHYIKFYVDLSYPQMETPDFTLSKVDSPADCVQALPLFKEFFLTSPMNPIFGFHPGNVDFDDLPKATYGPEDFLIVAKDSKGDLVGFAANKVKATVPQRAVHSPEEIEIIEFLKYVEKQEQQDKLPQRWIELRVLSVSERWRGRGVGRRLVEASVDAARAAGFSSIMMCCINEYTARIARSLGWKEHYRLAYSDYPHLSGRTIQLTPNPPHDHVYCYYKEL